MHTQVSDIRLSHDSSSPRRKAEEDRVRKEEEKARRELIKQEYLRRKQQALMEEQGLAKPRPRTKSRRSRPKSLHRDGYSSLSKGSTTRKQLVSFLFLSATACIISICIWSPCVGVCVCVWCRQTSEGARADQSSGLGNRQQQGR